MLIAYLKDGTPIKFSHAVDYYEAIGSGRMLQRPPGESVPEAKAEPEGEVVKGIEPIASVISEKSVEQLSVKDRPIKLKRK